MKCTETRTLLSSYLDGAVTGKQMHDTEHHLAICAECSDEYRMLQRTQRMVARLGRKQVPENLALQIRVTLSREAAKARRPVWAGLRTRLDNTAHAFLMPATAGVLSAIIFFGLLIGFFAPMPLQGSDVPTLLYTPAELKFAPFEIGMGAINADSIVVQVSVDATGHVQDYKVLAGPKDMDQYLPQLNNTLIFTVFRPATSFGQPTTGSAVLSFSKVNVKG